MKYKLLALISLLPVFTSGQVYKSHTFQKDRLSISLNEGTLQIIPLSDNAIRVEWEKDEIKETREFILTNGISVPAFACSENNSKLYLKTKSMTVIFDKQNGAVQFSEPSGKLFLKEQPGSRMLTRDSIQGEPCFMAQQSFDSPGNEYLFGLGQFQDGHFNLRNITRKLVQVNTQISIPFIYSSRGYGLLWHQYGLTYFNPADNYIPLMLQNAASGDKGEAEVTTTAGTRKIAQQQSLYNGNFIAPNDGVYSIMLDLGNMDNRHLVMIDDSAYIDQSNLWLPPAVSALVKLKAGPHKVQVVCRSTNTPKLSWKRADNTTTFRSPNARSLDYIVFKGKNADEVIAQYRRLSGNVPMLPLWAYGFWQCRERYTSGKHLVETVRQFRQRDLPMDVIVQDWQYWGKYGWGVPKFDETNYPDPAGFIQQLHNLNARFSISVWENPDKNSTIGKEYVAKNAFIPNSQWIDVFNAATRKIHWEALKENLFNYGVDSWWMDATEPENDALAGKTTLFGPGDLYRLVYPLFVSQTVYEGQRETNPGKRVCILTRSAFAGQQRYGTINWSGDIGGTWDSYKRQIVAGLNYSLTGMPYWTTDIGGFFRPGRSQYTDEKYHDLLTRWFQWGAFNPVFRIHGYQTETEPWKYGETVEANMRSMLNLRYRLLPYIYSEAWRISSKGATLMRPLVMDFGNDTTAVQQPFEYMFGQSLLVAPVTEPNSTEWNVYLPASSGWYDFYTGRRFTGKQTIKTEAPLSRIPLFVKTGAIVPMAKLMQYTSERSFDSLEIRIYTGADGRLSLYNDEGDNYNYEKGQYRVIPFQWNEKKQTLVIGKMQGNYKGAPAKYVFNIVWVNETTGHGADQAQEYKTMIYTGEEISIRKNNR